jgi:hypothetical protein
MSNGAARRRIAKLEGSLSSGPPSCSGSKRRKPSLLCPTTSDPCWVRHRTSTRCSGSASALRPQPVPTYEGSLVSRSRRRSARRSGTPSSSSSWPRRSTSKSFDSVQLEDLRLSLLICGMVAPELEAEVPECRAAPPSAGLAISRRPAQSRSGR